MEDEIQSLKAEMKALRNDFQELSVACKQLESERDSIKEILLRYRYLEQTRDDGK